MVQGNVISESHPDEICLVSYLESPHSAEFQDVRHHLVVCPACREKVMDIQATLKAMKGPFPPLGSHSGGEHPAESAIAGYVDRRLPPDRLSAIRQHLYNCSFCTKSALHYAISSVEMRRSIQPIESPAQLQTNCQEPPKKIRWYQRFQFLFFWRMPVWIGVPATAVATIVLFFLLSHINDRKVVKVVTDYEKAEKQAYQITSYQDKAEVVFTAPKGNIPGIGFFGAARKRSEPFQGLQVQVQDDRHLFLKWSEIKTARIYEVQIYSVNDKGRTLIGQTAISGNTEVLLQVSGIMPGKRYEWELMGQTTDGGSFLTRGGFVVGVEVRF